MRVATSRTALLLCGALVLTGCRGSSTPSAPSVTYENVAGTYTGNLDATSSGFTLTGTLTVALQQSDGVLTGTSTVQASMTDGAAATPIQGTAAISGTVAPGSNPAVTFTHQSVPCPALPLSPWTGTYDSASGALTASGSVRVITSACVLVRSFPQTVVLRR